MKSVIASLLIAITIISGSLIYTKSLKSISGEMTSCATSIKEHINNENYKAAIDEEEKLHKFFKNKRLILAGTVDHSIIVKIEENFAEMHSYTVKEQQYDAAAKCDALIYYFKYLPSNYSLKIENIL